MRLHLPPDAEMGRFPGLVSNSCALIIVFDSAIVNTPNFVILIVIESDTVASKKCFPKGGQHDTRQHTRIC